MKIKCPRCGREGVFYEDVRDLKSGSRTYYFVIHRYRDAEGRWRTRKCSLGSDSYIYVSRTHTLPYQGVRIVLSNVIRPENLVRLSIKCIDNAAKFVRRLDDSGRREVVVGIRKLLPKLLSKVRELEELVGSFEK